GQQEADGDDIPREVVGERVGHVPDLVDAPDLVLDGAVIQLERTRAQQYPAPPAGLPERSTSPEVGEKEESADGGRPAQRVEQPVGDETDVRRPTVVEVMPVQQLMEHGFVDECDRADAEGDS